MKTNGHYKRNGATYETVGVKRADGTVAVGKFTGSGEVANLLITVAGSKDRHVAFLNFLRSRAFAESAKLDDSFNPVPVASVPEWEDGTEFGPDGAGFVRCKGNKTRPARCHTNYVYELRIACGYVEELLSHDSVLSFEQVFVSDSRPAVHGSGNASGDVTAQVRRAMRRRDVREMKMDKRKDIHCEDERMGCAESSKQYGDYANVEQV